jgi:hypothetical protein
LSKNILNKYALLRHKSTFIDQIPNQKYKIAEIKEKEDEKSNIKEELKVAFKHEDYNKIIKTMAIRPQNNRVKMEYPKANFYIKKNVNIKHFYMIRKLINQKLKNTYKSPYMEHLIAKGYYMHHKIEDYPKYFNYYMICYLINNIKCHFTLKYYDTLLFYNQQEYFIRYFRKNESYIVLNYLFYFVYDKDIETVVKNKKKILSKQEIINMYNNLLKSNYNFIGTMEIFEEIAVYYRNIGINNINLSKFMTLENIKPVHGEKIKYLYAKDIPTQKFPNCYPNVFPLVGVMLNYIKIYLNDRKYLKLKTNDNNNYNKSHFIISSNDKKDKSGSDNNKKRKNKGNEDNILMNLSLSLSKDKNITDKSNEFEEKKNLHNSNRRLKIDMDIYDVETLINKILFGYKSINKKKKIIIKYNS